MADRAQDYGKLAADIRDHLGRTNIVKADHCETKLRLELKEMPSAEMTEQIKSLPGVLRVTSEGTTYQIVVGQQAPIIYQELTRILSAEDPAQPKQTFLSKIIAMMSAVFAPFVFILAGAGLMQGILIIVLQFNASFAGTGTYQVLNFISWAPFTFLPVMIAVTASQHFKCNTFIAMWCCLALVSPDWTAMANQIASGQPLDFLGINLSQTVYTSTVLPPLLLVLLLSYLERWVEKVLPEIVRKLFTPVICAAIMVPVTILIVGPVSDWAASTIAQGYDAIYEVVPEIAGIIVGGVWEILVIFGVHWGVMPSIMSNIATNGFDSFLAFETCASIAQLGACIGVWIKSRRKEMKHVALAASMTAVFGITEPAVYGVTLKLKKPFVCACIAGAIGAAVVPFFHTVYYVYAAIPSILTTVDTISADNPTSFIGMLLGCAVTVAAAILLVLIVGFDDEPELKPAQGLQLVASGLKNSPASAQTSAGRNAASDVAVIDVGAQNVVINAPCGGTVGLLADLTDPEFSDGLLGKGVYILPDNSEILAPFDCVVSELAPNKNKLKLIGSDGVEVSIQIGISTDALEGRYINAYIQAGDAVKNGEKLISFDLDAIGKDYEMVIPIYIQNSENFSEIELLQQSGPILAGEPLIRIGTVAESE